MLSRAREVVSACSVVPAERAVTPLAHAPSGVSSGSGERTQLTMRVLSSKNARRGAPGAPLKGKGRTV